MNKKMAIALTLAFTTSLCACGQKPAENTSEGSEPSASVQVQNPYHSCTKDELTGATGFSLSAPLKAENVSYAYIDGDNPTAEMTFSLGGATFVYRAKPSAEAKDISGMYYEWTEKNDVSVAYCDATVGWNEGKEGCIRWYDAVPGVNYALSMTEGASESLLTDTAALLFSPLQGDTGEDIGDFRVDFSELLSEISETCQPGTAGVSLRCLAASAKLADLFTAYSPADPQIISSTEGFIESLDAEQAGELIVPFNSILSAFRELNQENKAELLSSCGYTVRFETWDYDTIERQIRVIFNALPIEKLYVPVLDQYVYAIQNEIDRQTLVDLNLNVMIADADKPQLEHIGYLIDDLDGNGIPELIVGTINGEDYFKNLIFDIYTLDEAGYPKLLFRSGERNRLYSAGSNVFSNVGSNSAMSTVHTTLRLKNGQFTDLGKETPEEYYSPLDLSPLNNW